MFKWATVRLFLWMALAVWSFFQAWAMLRSPSVPPAFAEHEDVFIPPRAGVTFQYAEAVTTDTRDFWQKPDQVLDELGDLGGASVADIGCGEGYFTMRLLERVGEDGLVFATDIQSQVLDHLAREVPTSLASRLQLVLAEENHVGIEGTVDFIFLVQVLGEVKDQVPFLKDLMSLMDEQSKLILIDSKHVTDPNLGYTRPLNQTRLLSQLARIGLVPDPEIPLERLQFLPKQFFFVLVKKAATDSGFEPMPM